MRIVGAHHIPSITTMEAFDRRDLEEVMVCDCSEDLMLQICQGALVSNEFNAESLIH